MRLIGLAVSLTLAEVVEASSSSALKSWRWASRTSSAVESAVCSGW